MVDSFLLPVFVKILVKILKAFPNNLEYCFTYSKVLAYSTMVRDRGSNQKFIEASSLKNDNFKVYLIKDALNIPKS